MQTKEPYSNALWKKKKKLFLFWKQGNLGWKMEIFKYEREYHHDNTALVLVAKTEQYVKKDSYTSLFSVGIELS